MVFQPKGNASADKSSGAPNINAWVDQIADAVRERLIQQGVPLAAGATAPSKPATQWQHLVQEGADRIGSGAEGPFQPHILQGSDELAGKIDHTLLKPEATREEITRMCEEARKWHFATVCVNSTYIGLVADLLAGSGVKPIAVVGFPLGAGSSASKAFEAREAIRAGAQEIDMVTNVGALKSRDYSLVLEDIRAVVEASKPYAVKVILETSNLDNDQKIIVCALSKAAGAAFVKTSTGFGTGGATAEDIALMRRIVGPDMGVKASGGIRTYEDATKMIAAGASRIGASASVAIVTKKATDSGSGKKKTDGDGSGGKKPFKNSLY